MIWKPNTFGIVMFIIGIIIEFAPLSVKKIMAKFMDGKEIESVSYGTIISAFDIDHFFLDE